MTDIPLPSEVLPSPGLEPLPGLESLPDDMAGELAGKLGRDIPRPLLDLALTHPSAVGEGIERTLYSNQRLEFLGDAALGLIVAEYLFANEPELPEGALTQRKAAAVRGASLAQAAVRLELGKYLRLGKGEEARGGRLRETILADAFEALVGALLISFGFEAAKGFVLEALAPEVESAATNAVSVKNLLQEQAQALGLGTPSYRSDAISGPAHERHFTACAIINGEARGDGVGRSKKEAESNAAAVALEWLNALPTGEYKVLEQSI